MHRASFPKLNEARQRQLRGQSLITSYRAAYLHFIFPTGGACVYRAAVRYQLNFFRPCVCLSDIRRRVRRRGTNFVFAPREVTLSLSLSLSLSLLPLYLRHELIAID